MFLLPSNVNIKHATSILIFKNEIQIVNEVRNCTLADWDSMGCVITQTRGRAFQTLGRAFSFLLNPKNSAKCFKRSGERFKGSAACFETNARPNLLINGHPSYI